jgi:hypothetical protein
MNLVKVCTQSKVAVRKETPSTPLLLADEGKRLRRVKRVQQVQISLNHHRVESPPIRVDMPTDAYSGRLRHKRILHRHSQDLSFGVQVEVLSASVSVPRMGTCAARVMYLRVTASP